VRPKVEKNKDSPENQKTHTNNTPNFPLVFAFLRFHPQGSLGFLRGLKSPKKRSPGFTIGCLESQILQKEETWEQTSPRVALG